MTCRPQASSAKHHRKHWPLLIVAILLVAGIATATFLYLKSTSTKQSDPADQTNQSTSSKSDDDQSTKPDDQPAPEDPTLTRAKEILASMTIDEKVGQMFIVRVPTENAVEDVSTYHIGGYIMFGRDFTGETRDQIVQTINSWQANAKIPLLIGVDEEGGIVNRVSTNRNLRAVPFWSPQALYTEGGFDLIRSDTKEKAELLHSLGVNLNFAPVSDVSQNPNDFIYSRSFGKDGAATAEYVRNVVEVMQEQKMGSVLKHFPGYGNNTDTHTGIAYDNRPYDTFTSSDFLPFQAGIDAGASMVLVSHNVVNAIDSQSPASLSSRAHEILRNDLGFNGVIITDDLVMDGVRNFAGDAEVAVRAVEAGNDMLCCTNFWEQIPAVTNAVNSGRISEERINESVLRILQLKISLSIIS